MWERAKKIARETLDGKLWLPEVGKSTHYHASCVHPGWVREMKKMHKLGVHTFYRPRAWGDGADAPSGATRETAAIRRARRKPEQRIGRDCLRDQLVTSRYRARRRDWAPNG